MWYSSRHIRPYQHPVHPQYRATPCPPTKANDMREPIPIPIKIGLAIIIAMIAIAVIGYWGGMWDVEP